MVDLRTFTVKPIRLPSGYIDTGTETNPTAAATPDGKYVVMPYQYYSDGSNHLLLISTKIDQIAYNFDLGFVDVAGLAVSPVNNPGSIYAYLFGAGPDGNFAVTAFDLNGGSPTFGQVLPATEVSLTSFFSNQYSMRSSAINPEGTRLTIGGFKSWKTSPNPNVVEVDTGKMFTDPAHAIVGNATASGGVRPYGLAMASIVTTPPGTAPTVTSVTGPITNDVPNTITVTGTNFASGAMVRIGTQPPLPATVNSSTNLQVTVPQNAPAQANLDVVVTNPNISGPRNQQYQSGLLKAGLTIKANPAFQPQNLFASFRLGAYGVSVFDPTKGTMLDNHTGPQPIGITFNGDGQEIYGASPGKPGQVATPEAVAWNPANDSVEAEVPFPSPANQVSFLVGASAIQASVNPATGTAVVFVPVGTYASGKTDVALEMVDTISSSPTFNMVLSTIQVGLANVSFGLQIYGGAATPDGKYVYVGYEYFPKGGQNYVYELTAFDVVHATVTTTSLDALGVAEYLSQLYVTPDGQSLLVNGAGQSSYAGPIAVLDIGANPKNPALVANIYGTPPGHVGGAGPFYFGSWQVVGNRLFALDFTQNAIVVFNFDRNTYNFDQLRAHPLPYAAGTLAVTPDGGMIYVAYPYRDMIGVLDAGKLVNGQDPLITNIGAFPGVYQVTVSPATQLQITTTSLPSGTQGAPYKASLSAKRDYRNPHHAQEPIVHGAGYRLRAAAG